MAKINKIIHERVRLLIVTHLASSEKKSVSFTELQNSLELTPGNLSSQLKKLKQADYVKIHKTFRDNKPYTSVRITETGRKSLHEYIKEMESIISGLKSR